MDNKTDVQNGHGEDYQKLVDYGISTKVASQLETIYKTGKLLHSDLDERALEALKEFGAEDAIAVLRQFCDSNLEHVANKSAFLCGQMKTYRQKLKSSGTLVTAKGPDEAKIKEILDRTGYSLEVTTGQRKYGGPPPNWDAEQPGSGHEVFVGKIPKDVFEDEIIPLFEECGRIWDLRLMMDPMTGFNRGYAFITYCTKEGAQESTTKFDNYEIKSGKRIRVNVSIANVRLFVGNIPKNKSREEIREDFSKRTDNLQDVIVYGSADNPKLKNRGFAFLEYDSHKTASTARRKLATTRAKVWGCDIIVDWADPVEEPDANTMQKVKVLYVRNLTSDVTEEQLKEKFNPYGKIEKVKKIKDYGFVHFEERDDAVKALEELNGEKLGTLEMEISLAKPPSENKKKEQRKREQDKRSMMYGGGWGDDYWGPPMQMGGRMGGGPPHRGMMRGGGPMMPMRGGYDGYYEEYDDYYGYDNYGYGGYGGGRGGGRGGGPPGMGPKGPRGAARGGMMGGRGTQRGGPVPPRGGRGMGPGMMPGTMGAPHRGRGASPGSMAKKPMATNKRKSPMETNASQSKRGRNMGGWGTQPIAQQPLNQSGYGYGAGSSDGQEWYQDSFGPQWQ